MAIPYVKQTWTDGSSAASAARLGVIETGIFDAHYQPAVHVFHNASQSITNSTVTALAFNSERFDQASNTGDTMHDTATNNSRLTCRYAGVYLIVGNFQWTAVGGGERQAIIRLNGATIIARRNDLGSASIAQWQNVAMAYALAVNDYVELCAFQSSGGSLNVNFNANDSPEFAMVRVA